MPVTCADDVTEPVKELGTEPADGSGGGLEGDVGDRRLALSVDAP
jgi:hypothetical protein